MEQGDDTEGETAEKAEDDEMSHLLVAMKTTDIPHTSSSGHHSGRWTREASPRVHREVVPM
jgi:hypothetical protein